MAERTSTSLASQALAVKALFSHQACNSVPTGFIDETGIHDYIGHLHETLDCYQLFDTFIGEFGALVAFDSIEYQNEAMQIAITNGVAGKYQYDYALGYGKQSLGRLSITRDTDFKLNEIEAAEVMIAGLALPLRNALRYQYAIRCVQRDELTGLRNGSYYHDVIELEIERARRYKKPFSLLMIDLDDLTSINTEYSRSAGDLILVEVARRIEQQARSSDVVYRNGGDKFLVFMPNTGRPEAKQAAARIKDSVTLKGYDYAGKKIAFTLSAGVVTVSSSDTADKLMSRVNKALFHAKILGKNSIYGEIPSENEQIGEI